MSRSTLRLMTVLLVLAPTPLPAQVIGVFADPSGSRCNLEARPEVVTNAYLLFRGFGIRGIQGFEFGVRGLPEGWVAFAEYCPWCGVTLPSVFGNGATFSWVSCQDEDAVLIAPVTLLATSDVSNVQLVVGARVPPTNPAFACPQVFLCDAPVYTRICVAGQTTYVNSDIACSVDVATESWGGIKAIFR